MLDISESQWLEFHAMVEANGPSIISNEISAMVFRGSDDSITLEYVRAPYSDALTFVEILENKPEKFQDAGFHTVLALAKSLEMHVRLLFLGETKKQFENEAFQLSSCLRIMQKVVDGKEQTSVSITGFQSKEFKGAGWRWEKFCSIDSQKRTKFINDAFWIYRQGNPYRHNQVTSWSEVKPVYKETQKSFKRFIKLFDELME
jgi:hypothetical protein